MLGDQVRTNFDHDEHLPRLLEGKPFCQCLFPFSKGGRNGNGFLKIMIKVWAVYFCPVKDDAFSPRIKNENEPSAVDLFRRGGRIGFANEVGAAVWSKSILKDRNSMDPATVHGFGSAVAKNIIYIYIYIYYFFLVYILQTVTHIFATNDPPCLEQPSTGLEKDSIFVLRSLGTYKDKGVAPTSIRRFVKKLSFEEHVSGQSFALGL